MRTIGAFEAKTHFSALLSQIEVGEQILITKHGKPVAKLSAVSNFNQNTVQQAIRRLKKFSQDKKLAGLDWKMLRDEGRR